MFALAHFKYLSNFRCPLVLICADPLESGTGEVVSPNLDEPEALGTTGLVEGNLEAKAEELKTAGLVALNLDGLLALE